MQQQHRSSSGSSSIVSGDVLRILLPLGSNVTGSNVTSMSAQHCCVEVSWKLWQSNTCRRNGVCFRIGVAERLCHLWCLGCQMAVNVCALWVLGKHCMRKHIPRNADESGFVRRGQAEVWLMS